MLAVECHVAELLGQTVGDGITNTSLTPGDNTGHLLLRKTII